MKGRAIRRTAWVLVLCAAALPARAGSLSGGNEAARTLVKPPPGFSESCGRYSWLCTNSNRPATVDASGNDDAGLIGVADAINRRVNHDITQMTDAENYGVEEYWTLPNNGRGDCEDLVLEKYKLLLDAGVDSHRLSMAIVLDRHRDNHLVLILRSGTGDLVLDSLESAILPWNQTEYTFLAMQALDDKSEWEVVVNRSRSYALLAQR
jgi:predicted transglutaminase-like cysteine proteinase